MDKSRKACFFLLFVTALYIVIRLLRFYSLTNSYFIRFHLTDLLFIPVQLTFTLIFLRYIKRNHSLTLPTVFVWVNFILMSTLFEWYLPVCRNSPEQTADATDVLMYFAGTLLFIFLQKRRF
ncbi:MAG: hypothetical protein J0G96_05155 [Flavobacteriia bacterium]|nr:hypothetical protein [Flavobacteriia bacterium]OJX35112.1 MAG: hypothetical protein BGO87_08095 [Flavobacteriia bacterium 40-80]